MKHLQKEKFRPKKTDEAEDLRKVINDPKWHQIQALVAAVIKVFDDKP